MAAEGKAVSSNYFKNKNFKEEFDRKYRLCKRHEETVVHLTSVSPY
jgi:hypothetical protein